MGKLSFGRVLGCFCLSPGSGSLKSQDEFERRQMIASDHKSQVVRLKDVVENHTLDFQLKPKMVVLKVSMHCNGCARKVEKHISKMKGVTSYKVDLESKMVVVIGDIVPFEVLDSL